MLARRPDDEPAETRRADALQDLLQPRALSFVFDAPRHADVRDGRHVDEESARERDVARDACAFAGDRVLRHLDDDLLPFAQEVGDGGLGAMIRDVIELQIVAAVCLEVLEVFDDVGDVEERIALEPEVDEGRLHAGQDLRDAPFVDVADDGAVPRALDPELDDLPFVEHGDARFVFRSVDDDLARHGRDYVILSRADNEGCPTS